MPKETYTVGIVGCGSTGDAHARAYRNHDQTEVVAAAEPTESTREAFVDEFGVPSAYTTHTEMLAAEELDVVSVCTFHGSHAAITVDAAEADVSGVWCEKPMATCLGEARDMLDAAERNGTKLAVAHKRRFHPVHERARRLVADGAVGDPQFVTGAKSAGLLNWGTHVVDLVRFLLGDPDLEWVMGQVERQTDRYERGVPIEDRCVGQICFDDGTRMTYESDMPDPETGGPTLRITGSEGRLDLDLDTAVTVRDEDGTETYDPTPEFGSLYEPCLDGYVAWLDGEQDRHRCAGSEAYGVMEALMGIYESARTNAVVRAPVRTRANPLSVMIDDGDLPVEHPGPYDIRIPYGSVRMDN